jgi:hypothetical protein
MSSSNRHPGTAARRLRRAFFLQAGCGLIAALLAAPAPALAQGVIHFSLSGGTITQYKVSDDGTGLQTLTLIPQESDPRVVATTQSGYPGGRQYLYPVYSPTGSVYRNWRVWSEGTGQSKPVISINGPLYGYGGGSGRWSNDGLDSFISFCLYDPATGHYYTYRAHVSATDIASPTFQPITTLSDPRLELVKDWPGPPSFYWWGHDGARFYYNDPRDFSKLRVKVVGVGVTLDDDAIVYIAPASLAELHVGPPVDPLNPDRYLVASIPGGNGILAIDLVTQTSWWLATPNVTSNKASGRNYFTCFLATCGSMVMS